MGRLSQIDAAVRGGFLDTAFAELALYNTRAILTDESVFEDLVIGARELGFEEAGRWETQVLMTSEAPGSIFMEQTRDVGLVGFAASEYWSHLLPNSISIGNPTRISKELLSSFRVIVLSAYSISDVEESSDLLLDFANSGGIVILEEPNRGGRNLLGVDHTIRNVPGEFTLDGAGGPVEVLPFSIGGGPFAGVDYGSIGELVLAGTTPAGERVPLVQKRQTGLGAIYWVCCNIGNHIVVNPGQDHAMAEVVRDYFDSEIGGFKSIWPTVFDAEIEQFGPSRFRISYTVDSPTPILISLRSAAKRALVLEDGQAIELVPFGPVISAVLPAGTHVATLDTSARLISISVTSIWLLGLILAGVVLSVGWQRFEKDGPSSVSVVAEAIRRFLNPRWAGELRIPQGTLKAQAPRIETKFDVLSTESGTLERFVPDSPAEVLAVVSLEISASERLDKGFSVDDLRLHTADGQSIRPMAPGNIDIKVHPRSRLLSLLDRRQPRLGGDIILGQGESASGFVLFNLRGDSEIRWLSVSSSPEQRIEIA